MGFCYFTKAIQAGRLVAGDTFVVDNASIHFGSSSWETLLLLCNSNQVHLCFLPKYSPELSPVELVFSYLKGFIRNNRCPTDKLWEIMAQGLVELPYEMLLKFYFRCTQILFRYQLGTYEQDVNT